MKPMLIISFVHQLTASFGVGIVYNETYAENGNAATLVCNISKEGFTQSWRKGFRVLTQGFEINEKIHDHERLEVTIDGMFYNLKINNITFDDFDTYWCETQKGNSLTADGTNLIRLVPSTVHFTEETTTDKKSESFPSTLSDKSSSEETNYEEWQEDSEKSTILATSSTSQTITNKGMKVSQSSYYGLLATGFVVLCLSVSCNFVINKCRATIDRRKIGVQMAMNIRTFFVETILITTLQMK